MFTHTTQCVRGVLDPPVSGFSLSLYRHPFLYTLCSSLFTLLLKAEVALWRHIALTAYLANEAGPVSLVLDLRIVHDRVGSTTDPTLNGHLKYPNNFDQSLNDAVADKIRKYRVDYNNRSPSVVSFIPAIASTSGRLHSEFVRLLFLQAHRETDRFFTSSGVQSV
jgi:hypothetical protein